MSSLQSFCSKLHVIHNTKSIHISCYDKLCIEIYVCHHLHSRLLRCTEVRDSTTDVILYKYNLIDEGKKESQIASVIHNSIPESDCYRARRESDRYSFHLRVLLQKKCHLTIAKKLLV